MILSNYKMRMVLQRLNFQNKKLDKSLASLVFDGLVKKEDCYFINSLFKNQKHIKKNDFIDNTGYEAFINSIHIDDYVDYDFLIQAFLFVDNIFTSWSKLNNNLILIGIVSETDFGVNVKFHTKRNNEFWIKESEVENFEESITLLDSRYSPHSAGHGE